MHRAKGDRLVRASVLSVCDNDVFWYQVYQTRLWERMLNRSASLAMSTSILEALPGKFDITWHSPSILYIRTPHSSSLKSRSMGLYYFHKKFYNALVVTKFEVLKAA